MDCSKDEPLALLDQFLDIQIFEDLESFYNSASYLQEQGYLVILDKSNHQYTIHNIDEDELGNPIKHVHLFEQEIKAKLFFLRRQTIRCIEQAFKEVYDNKSRSIGLGDFLKAQLNRFLNFQSTKSFPFLINYIQEIENVINHYLANRNEELISTDHSERLNTFNLSERYTILTLKELHSIAINQDLIDETVSENLFISAFTIKNPTPIRFICDIKTLVVFFESIKPMFGNFNARILEESKAFKTKHGTFVSQTNYNKAKSKLTETDYTNRQSLRTQLARLQG